MAAGDALIQDLITPPVHDIVCIERLTVGPADPLAKGENKLTLTVARLDALRQVHLNRIPQWRPAGPGCAVHPPTDNTDITGTRGHAYPGTPILADAVDTADHNRLGPDPLSNGRQFPRFDQFPQNRRLIPGIPSSPLTF